MATPAQHPDAARSAGEDARDRAGDVVAVLLAAGGGSRFAGSTHKLLAPLNGRPVYAWSLDAVLSAGFPTVVVTGAVPLTLPPAPGLTVVHNEEWSRGQMTSVQCGIRAARARDAGAIVVGLADQPFVTSDAWLAVARSTSPIAVATYDGQRGNPVRLDATVWDLLPADGDEGARGLMRVSPWLVEEVPCTGSAVDIDTLEDLERWT